MEKTIAAISSGLTPSGIIIVRMSGEKALEIADKIYRSRNGKKKLKDQPSHTIHYGYIHDGDKDIDEVLVSVMKAPHTYTGEDLVEVNCHGGILVARSVLELMLRSGAVMAEPGEFTRRAFLNGKIDLAKAEAVIDVIDAKNRFALDAGMKGLKGAVSNKIKELRDKILDEVSFIEAALDDPEHYDLSGYSEILSGKLKPIQEEIRKLIRHADYGSRMKEGIRTVIAGRPNAGKSSLLNLLSGYDKAIVTDIAGTTRDVLEETVHIGPVTLLLMDTAGIRKTGDVVEKIGVDKAREALSDADLVLYLVDVREGMNEEDREILEACADKKVILLKNKSDLYSEEQAEESEPGKAEKCAASTESERPDGIVREISFSAVTKEGLEELESLIVSLFENQEITENDEVLITSIRQKECLESADKALDYVFSGIENEESEEFLTIDLMEAYAELGKIIGEEVGEDVINRVFEKFCMGK